jgi:transaldolase/glucose-6-phosphate isomerase
MANPLLEVQKYGQAIWYDNIRRGLITSGELQAMIERDGLLGVTSNPTLFTLAITGSGDYDQALKALVKGGVGTAVDLYERLALHDVQLAADLLYPVYLRTAGRDGFVSLEVPPWLANDTRGTIEEARRLHADVRRDNVLIKVPATPAGIQAIRQLIGEGISVHATLLFSVEVYEAVADAFMAGLESYGAKGGDVSKVASVAGFLISRVDTLIDSRLEALLDTTTDPEQRKKLKGIVGKVALANARLAHARYCDLQATERWQRLRERQARPQRLLWASTGVRNPRYSRALYVEELIGPDTVNSLPAETLAAFRETGRVRPSLTENHTENLDEACETLNTLAEVGIALAEVTKTLLDEGVKKLNDQFDRLMAAIEQKRQALLQGALDSQVFRLGELAEAVAQTLDEWRIEGKVRRLWAGDSSLWTGTDEGRWLAWLHAPEVQLEHTEHFTSLVEGVRSAGLAHVVLLGMGGASLCPEVLGRIFGAAAGFPELIVVDSVIPAEIRRVQSTIDPARTLFIVSSKSGGTIETNALLGYFLDRVRRAVGAAKAGSHFLAITDAKTRLHTRAKAEHFRGIFFGVQGIGGRFAALSNFGMVPAALLGLDVRRFLTSAGVMVQSCAACVPPELNPGVALGCVLGTLAKAGRDKVTLVLAPALASLGAWLEQLLAESTGKNGQGILIIDEPPGSSQVYGGDRLFMQVRLRSVPSPEQDRLIDSLEQEGHPVARITLAEESDLGQEFFRWELATAVAGSILGVNPFNQPDVEASKVAARTYTSAYEAQGQLPVQTPLLVEDGLALFAAPHNADQLLTAAGGRKSVQALVDAHLRRLEPGDYFALNAFVERSPANARHLQAIRLAVRDRFRVATMIGYGPRLLHSTGQLHKGGPNTGVFVQITADDAEDLPIAGQKYSFGVLHRAQELADFEVLGQRGRRIVRIHLGQDVQAGLQRLREVVAG